jgi:hypothetical protein
LPAVKKKKRLHLQLLQPPPLLLLRPSLKRSKTLALLAPLLQLLPLLVQLPLSLALPPLLPLLLPSNHLLIAQKATLGWLFFVLQSWQCA